MYCYKCGGLIDDSAKFCSKCGAEVVKKLKKEERRDLQETTIKTRVEVEKDETEEKKENDLEFDDSSNSDKTQKTKRSFWDPILLVISWIAGYLLFYYLGATAILFYVVIAIALLFPKWYLKKKPYNNKLVLVISLVGLLGALLSPLLGIFLGVTALSFYFRAMKSERKQAILILSIITILLAIGSFIVYLLLNL